MTPLERISERVSRDGNPNLSDTPRPILSLAEFFEGNNVQGSIGCNLDAQPSPAQIHQRLKEIAGRSNVADVRVVVTQFDDPSWPFSDTIWVVTDAEPDEVTTWFGEDMHLDACFAGWYEDTPTEPYSVPQGMKIVVCQWD
jgi:hypothetical protein